MLTKKKDRWPQTYVFIHSPLGSVVSRRFCPHMLFFLWLSTVVFRKCIFPLGCSTYCVESVDFYISPTCAGPSMKDHLLKWLLHFKRQSFKRESFCRDIAIYPTYPPKANLHRRGGRRPPPLWRLVFEGYVGYRAMSRSRQKDCLLKDCLLKSRSHFKEESWKDASKQ